MLQKYKIYGKASPTFTAQLCQGSPCGGFAAGFGPVGAGVGVCTGVFCATA